MLSPPPVLIPKIPKSDLVDGFVKGRITIVMPAYNEADHIRKSVSDVSKGFESLTPDYEIIVVDDGSQDETKENIQELVNERIRLVSYPQNQGKGHALKLGCFSATGHYTFLFDSDSEIKPVELSDYLNALESSDLVIGSKRHPLSSVRTTVLRRFLSMGFNTLERILTGMEATDSQAGVKAVRSAALYRILPLLSVKKYAFDAELLTVASLLGLRIRELPVSLELRTAFSLRQVFRMLIDLLGITYRLHVTRWYQKNMVTLAETYKPIIPW